MSWVSVEGESNVCESERERKKMGKKSNGCQQWVMWAGLMNDRNKEGKGWPAIKEVWM